MTIKTKIDQRLQLARMGDLIEEQASSDIPEDKIDEPTLHEGELSEDSDDIWVVENVDDYVDDRIYICRFTTLGSCIPDTATVEDTRGDTESAGGWHHILHQAQQKSSPTTSLNHL